ncbi:MAG: amidohydrolase family protein [Gemmatimonadota bacterium]|nr:MAG: amidohydrolase family protein [Gemmatimonadota bacterium]
MPRFLCVVVVLALGALELSVPDRLAAQSSLDRQVQEFVAVSAPVVALTHATLIDGRGGPAVDDQTVILRGNRIEAVGSSGSVMVPDGAEVLDLTGKTLIPGLIMLHEHLFYTAGAGNYNTLGFSFPRLYLAGGVTTMRTGGSMMPYADINLKRSIDSGRVLGPTMDVTAPYLNGPGLPIAGVKALKGPEDAAVMVNYWAGEGSTSFKAYMQITRAELGSAVEAAHALDLKVTGHLCSVTYREAADLGIDNLEHGFTAATDFVADKQPDQCVSGGARQNSVLSLDLDGAAFRNLVAHLVERRVAVTSTNTVFETYTPGRPRASDGALDAMAAEPRDSYLRTRAQVAVSDSPWSRLFTKNMAMEKAFHDAGGLLVVGTDPTGYGGVVAGYANQRTVELLVEGGFSVPEAIKIATLNGATYLGLANSTGTIAAGMEADLVVVDGDLAADVSLIHRMEIVFKDGVGFDSRRIFDSVKGTVGIR